MAHIPDGFLSTPVAAGTLVAAGAVTALAARRARDGLDDRAAPTLGLATAAIFAIQAINFPVAAGTSGHLLGGVLAATIFGPWAAFLVITSVIIVQAVLFADGGLTAVGANILNIAGGGALVGYAIYRLLDLTLGGGRRRRAWAAALAAYVTTVLTGAAAGIEIGLSGVAPLQLAAGAMAGVHGVIGVAEAAGTGLAVTALTRRRPELLFGDGKEPAHPRLSRAAALAGLGAIAVVAGALSIVASAAPDSLQRVAIDLGFADAATAWQPAPIAAYEAWFADGLVTALAISLGVALLFLGVAALTRALAAGHEVRQVR
jgi:cobalt/nickel transport system permease protein